MGRDWCELVGERDLERIGIKVRLSGIWVVLGWWEVEGCSGHKFLESKIFFWNFNFFVIFFNFWHGPPCLVFKSDLEVDF